MIGRNSGMVWVIFGILFLFGFFYDRVVTWLERNGYDEGYTALLVVFGSLITLGGIAMIDWRAALLGLGAFASSGFWMVIGSWWRHVQRRRRGQRSQQDEVE